MTMGVHITKVELAAIGPTTLAFLSDTLQLRVAVCPSKPAAGELAAAIHSYETRSTTN